jgi:hypothetical protein
MDKMIIATDAPCRKFSGGGLKLERSNVHASGDLSNPHEYISV